MIRKPPTPEELWQRMIEPFREARSEAERFEPLSGGLGDKVPHHDDEEESREEFELRIDRELERTLAMTPEQIRADLAEMGYDVAALERQARTFLGLDTKKRNRLGFAALVATPIALTVFELLAPAVPELLPMAAHAPNGELPASAAAAAAAPHYDDFTPAAADAAARTLDKDGGSR